MEAFRVGSGVKLRVTAFSFFAFLWEAVVYALSLKRLWLWAVALRLQSPSQHIRAARNTNVGMIALFLIFS